MTAHETKACPYCAETIKSQAVVCRHCGRDLKTGRAPERQSGVPPVPRLLGIIGLICLILVCAAFSFAAMRR